jgi:hypothetical protein
MGKENVNSKEVVEDTGYGEVTGDDPEGPIFSTATGQYRYRKTYGNKDDIKGVCRRPPRQSDIHILHRRRRPCFESASA